MNYSDKSNHGRRPLGRVGKLSALLAAAAAVLAGGNTMAAEIEATLYPGQSASNSVSVTIPSMPPEADILFSFDCTGSMYDVLGTAKSQATRLMASLQGKGVSFRYGVASFMDYDSTNNSCGYANEYGSTGDYPYLLSQAPTADTNRVSAAINGLRIGGGADFPEDYTRTLYESYADPNLIWRTGARWITINFGDSVPHDCNLNEGIAGTGTTVWSTGKDPGRDGIVGTSDDLDLQTVLTEMASSRVVLLAARTTTNYFNYWNNWTGRTGGKAFLTSSGTLINDLMREITNSLTITCVSNVQVLVEPPAFNSWLAIAPPAYGQICSGDTRNYNLALTVPLGTPAGDYSFTLRVVDSMGITYKSNSVVVHVSPTIPLPVALNNSSLTWTTAPELPWFGQTNLSLDGFASARSFFIGDNANAGLHTTVAGPCTLSFYWKVSSQTNADILSFTSAGGGFTNHVKISGEVDWQPQSFYLTAGTQTLDWIYTKDLARSAGLDAGFVDVVTYTYGGTKPYITAQPQSQAPPASYPVSFTVGADGTPPLAYQWFFNGSPLPGQTDAALSLASALRTNGGAYLVVVTNHYGSVTSLVASLTIVPLIAEGDNSFSQLAVSALATNAVRVSAGAWHSLVLRADGRVVAWGDNYNGQCDIPTNLPAAMAVAAGGYHSLALLTNGTVVGWGENSSGQASPPAGLSNMVAIAAGSWHSLALLANGTIVTWGDNSTAQQLEVPPQATSVIAIAAGGNHSLALRTDGTVVAWGENTDAWGGYAGQSVPPADLTNVAAIAAGEYHSLAVKQNGIVVTWGDNSFGQSTPPASLTNAFAAAGGGSHSLVLKNDGTVAAWGSDLYGQCSLPRSLSHVAAISAGGAHSLLLVDVPSRAPRSDSPQLKGPVFTFKLQSVLGQVYILEYKNFLTDARWTPLATLTGNGAIQDFSDTKAAAAHGFYRLQVR